MIHELPTNSRQLTEQQLYSDLVVVGGGLAGVCCAIAAAREGISVILVQDRPVLGGNASSEVRLWVLGATSHLGNNNRWSREGGVINEILEENLYRNRQGNALIFDTIMLEKCMEQENLTLLLNTAVHEVHSDQANEISSVRAFCAQNSTSYRLHAPLFCDASGDGIVGFLAGAAFRMGAESKEEFGELFAPDQSYGQLLGHSMYFYSKDVGVPVKYQAPAWALKDITQIPRYRQFHTNMQGCNFWWLEYGGRMDTIHDTETIKWELWKVIYGIWDYFKNSGNFPEAETMTLEWVGHIPGKRESRRFEGDYILRQQDLVNQTHFPDAVAHGGWAVDLHPADGVFSELPGCTQWHSKGVYGIPYRCFYSRNVTNLFVAGRLISATHVAFGSTRVMATCGAGGQAVGIAAALCRELQTTPRALGTDHLEKLQLRLTRAGQFLPGIVVPDPEDLATQAQVSASSQLILRQLPANDEWQELDAACAMLLPLSAGTCPIFSFEVNAKAATTLHFELRQSAKPGNFTPEITLATQAVSVPSGISRAQLDFGHDLATSGYYFVQLHPNDAVAVRLNDSRITGILALTTAFNKAVATSSVQQPPDGIGIDRFEFWLPKRRPAGKNLALGIEPGLDQFQPQHVQRGHARPGDGVDAWVADPDDPNPELRLDWSHPVTFATLILELDSDWDHPMESVLMTHPEEVVPFMIRDFDVIDENDHVLLQRRDHHGAHFVHHFETPVTTSSLRLRILATHGAPAAIFRVRLLATKKAPI